MGQRDRESQTNTAARWWGAGGGGGVRERGRECEEERLMMKEGGRSRGEAGRVGGMVVSVVVFRRRSGWRR